MNKIATRVALLKIIAVAALALGTASISGVALGDDTPPSDNPPPGGRHRHDPAWAACKKQADDQQLEPGSARHEFMKTCMKSAKSSPPPAPAS